MSGGEQQLTIIARALTQQPHLYSYGRAHLSTDFGNQLKVLQQVKALQSQDIGYYPFDPIILTTFSFVTQKSR